MRTAKILPLALLLCQMAPPGAYAESAFSTIYNFARGFPVGFFAEGGIFYGGFQGPNPAGWGCGDVFELQPPAAAGGARTQTVLHSFTETGSDGCDLGLPPVLGADGALYGTTVAWGAYGFGVVYRLQPPGSPGGEWTETILYNFCPPGGDVGYAVSNLIPGRDGSFYLLTSVGRYAYGALTKLQPPEASGAAWTATVLYSFPETYLAGNLSQGDGVFYATTLYYGSDGPGLILQLTPPAAPGGIWTGTTLYKLAIGQGCTPKDLTLASDGTLYGTTYGTNEFGNGAGTVFSLTPPASPGDDWTYTMLKDFGPFHPNTPLIVRDGKVYGAVDSTDGGAVFELTPPSAPGGEWTTTYLHIFTDFEEPGGTLLMDETGTLYGATQNYSEQLGGTIYRIATK